MEIRTKFKPKDKIWAIGYVEGTEYKEDKAKQTKIWCVEDEPIQIAYIVVNDDGITYYTMDTEYHNEEDCFATKEEAQKECDRRNGKENNSRV